MWMNVLSPDGVGLGDRQMLSLGFSSPLAMLTRSEAAAIELRETAETVVVTAYLPGIPPQDVTVSVVPDGLILSGQQPLAYGRGYGYAVGYRRFEHRIPLPVRVQDSQRQIALRGDRLEITLPKATVRQGGSRWAAAPASRIAHGTWGEAVRHQWRRLGNAGRQMQHWLGRQLQRAGTALLED